jgi:large conductance mechanosensitive channel
MGLVNEFKEFAMRGNVVDMAVGIVIGAAFGKIVSSLVSDVIMPPVGLITQGVDFADLAIPLQKAYMKDGIDMPAVQIQSGLFMNTIINFLIVATAMFIVVKLMNKLKHLEDDKKAAVAAPPPPRQELLLEEIRDLLKDRG